MTALLKRRAHSKSPLLIRATPLSLTKKTTEHAMGEKKLKFVVDVEEGVQRISIQEHSVTYTKMAVNAFRTSERAQTDVGVSTVVIHTDINQDLKCRPQRVTLFLENADDKLSRKYHPCLGDGS